MKLLGPLAIPDPLTSHEAMEKFYHRDLDGLSRRGLCVERWRCEQALALLDQPPEKGTDIEWDWLWDRHERISERL